MDISIVIVNYKSKGLTLNCIKSIEEAHFGHLEHETIVVDNNSGDQITEILAWQHPGVIFVQSLVNRGMGGGNNIGIKRARGKYIVVMNPDTLALRDTFTQLYDFMENNPRVGIVGPKQFNPDRTVQESRYRYPKVLTLLYRRTFLGRLSFAQKAIKDFLMDDVSKETPHEVDWLLGFKRVEMVDDQWGGPGGFFSGNGAGGPRGYGNVYLGCAPGHRSCCDWRFFVGSVSCPA
jgi:GT2 family glycosyltransferase